MNRYSLEGKVAIVTGGTAGIGLAIGMELARAGARVTLAGRDPSRGKEAARACQKEGLGAEFRACDVTDPEAVKRLVEGVSRERGGLHALVTSAGTFAVKPALEFAPGEVDALLAVHVRGAFVCAQEAARVMIPAGGGKVLFISSFVAERAVPLQAPYIAAKGALVSLARALALEWAPHNVQVNALGPQLTRTPMTEGLWADSEKMAAVLSRTPAGRAGEPEDVAGAALFLCSPASDYLTGQHILVDGGRSAAG